MPPSPDPIECPECPAYFSGPNAVEKALEHYHAIPEAEEIAWRERQYQQQPEPPESESESEPSPPVQSERRGSPTEYRPESGSGSASGSPSLLQLIIVITGVGLFAAVVISQLLGFPNHHMDAPTQDLLTLFIIVSILMGVGPSAVEWASDFINSDQNAGSGSGSSWGYQQTGHPQDEDPEHAADQDPDRSDADSHSTSRGSVKSRFHGP